MLNTSILGQSQVCAVRGYPLLLEDGQQPRIAAVKRASLDLGFPSPLNIAMVRWCV